MVVRFVVIFFTCYFFIACTNGNKVRQKPEMIEFDKIMNEYFISYTPLFEPSIKRPGNNSGTILIKKINLSKVEMSHIKTKLKKWMD